MQAAQSTAALFRRLTWFATVPLDIRLAEGAGEPIGGGGMERYYIQVSRHSYLPLLIKELQENFVELVLSDDDLKKNPEENWWFEEVGEDGVSGTGIACKWHWPIDLLHLIHQISTPLPPTSSTSTSPTAPLRLILHLSSPPTDQLFIPPTIDACKTQFVSQLKEADFVRWGNTRRVTGLRRADLEAGWNGVVENDHDLHSRFTTKLLPLPLAPSVLPPSSTAESTASSVSSPPSRSASTDPGGMSSGPSKLESVYTCRSVPMRIYLPQGGPVIQEVVAPLDQEGNPTTLISLLRLHLPHLFPIPPSSASLPPFSRTQTLPLLPAPGVYPLAIPIVGGAEVPPEAEVAWLGCCVCGADGWLRVGIRLRG